MIMDSRTSASNDAIIHKAFTALKNMRWRKCEADNNYEWYYAECELYVIRKNSNRAYWFVKAKSPQSALDTVLSNEAN